MPPSSLLDHSSITFFKSQQMLGDKIVRLVYLLYPLSIFDQVSFYIFVLQFVFDLTMGYLYLIINCQLIFVLRFYLIFAPSKKTYIFSSRFKRRYLMPFFFGYLQKMVTIFDRRFIIIDNDKNICYIFAIPADHFAKSIVDAVQLVQRDMLL